MGTDPRYTGHRLQGEKDKPKRQRRRNGGRLKWAVLAVGIAAVIGIAAGLLLWQKPPHRDEEAGLTGTWRYEDAEYVFDGAGNGSLNLEAMRFAYVYRTEGERLYIDFEDDIVTDAAYTYAVTGDRLTLVGGEGTDGGTYQLTREES